MRRLRLFEPDDPPGDPAARSTFDLTKKVDEALGRDRWLKRVDIVRDLRKPRESRLSAASRVLD